MIAKAHATSAIGVLEEDHDYVKKAYRAFRCARLGLQVGLHPDLQQGRRLPRYEQLMHSVSNNTAIFEVEAVTFFTARKPNSGRIVLRAKEIAEDTSERFRANIEFLTEFYGFTRST